MISKLQRQSHKLQQVSSKSYIVHQIRMGSSKGEPTDPELREKIKEEVKAEEKGVYCEKAQVDMKFRTYSLTRFLKVVVRDNGLLGKQERWLADMRPRAATTRTPETTRIRRRKGSQRRSSARQRKESTQMIFCVFYL